MSSDRSAASDASLTWAEPVVGRIGAGRRGLWRLFPRASSPALKQLPIGSAFLVAVLLTVFVPSLAFTDMFMALLGVLFMALATALALVFTRYSALLPFALIVPLVDLAAVGFFRIGTGGPTSLFTSIMILPVIWIAGENGRRYIAIAGIGTSFFLLLPYLFDTSATASLNEWLRGVFAPLIYALVATVINETGRQRRKQVQAIRALAEERKKMLADAMGYTEQLHTNEARLVAADRLTRSVLDSVTEQSIVGTDITGRIDVWNPGAERMLGLSAAEAQGKRYIYEFHVQKELEDRSRELNYPPGETVLTPGFSALVEAARLGRADVRQWHYVRADGATVPVELAVTRRQDETGATFGYIFVATDVSQALEVSRLKDEFVGLISHELRTPLSSVLGYLDLMREDDENPLSAEQLQYLGVAERNANRLLRLVGDLLFTAQVGAGNFVLEATDVALGPVIEASVESAQPVAARAGVTIELQLPATPLIVRGDALRLGQACDNLLSNAIKFSPRDTTVTVAVVERGADALVTVADAGMGIPEAELDKLFTRFFRASTATRAAVPGVGLGLAITKAIVTAHHGVLDIASEEGVGTVLSFTVPLAGAATESVPLPVRLP